MEDNANVPLLIKRNEDNTTEPLLTPRNEDNADTSINIPLLMPETRFVMMDNRPNRFFRGSLVFLRNRINNWFTNSLNRIRITVIGWIITKATILWDSMKAAWQGVLNFPGYIGGRIQDAWQGIKNFLDYIGGRIQDAWQGFRNHLDATGIAIRDRWIAWRNSKFGAEFINTWKVAGPVIVTQVISMIIDQINQGFFNKNVSEAYSIVSTILVNFVNGLMFGMVTGLETLCGQAYGAQRYHMLGTYLQRSWIIVIITSIFLLPIYFFASKILRFVKQCDQIAEEAVKLQCDQIAKEAGKLALWFIPLMYSTGLSNCFLIFLEAQSNNWIMIILSFLAMLIHISFSEVLHRLLHMFGLNLDMLPTVLAYVVVNLGQLIYVVWCCPNTWTGFTRVAFHDLSSLFILSLESAAMLCLEEWYTATPMIVMTFIKARYKTISDHDVEVLLACVNMTNYAMKFSLGLLSAASARVSNALGEGNAEAAYYSVRTIGLMSLFIGLLESAAFVIFHGHVIHFFVSGDTAKELRDWLWLALVAIGLILINLQSVLSGIIVGVGWQRYAALVNLFCNYLLGIGSGLLMFNFKAEVSVIWIGILIGLTTQIIVLGTKAYLTNWNDEVLEATERVNHWAVVAEPGYTFNAILTYVGDKLFSNFTELDPLDLEDDITETISTREGGSGVENDAELSSSVSTRE